MRGRSTSGASYRQYIYNNIQSKQPGSLSSGGPGKRWNTFQKNLLDTCMKKK